MDKLLTLEEWAASLFGAHPPHIVTLRRWARECRIYPVPKRHGRTYYVAETARYVDPSQPIAAQVSEPTPRRGTLAEKIRKERESGKTA